MSFSDDSSASWDEDVGASMVNVIRALSPEALIISGFYSAVWGLVEQTAWQVLRARVPAYMLSGPHIYPSRHADSALLGALSLVFLPVLLAIRSGTCVA